MELAVFVEKFAELLEDTDPTTILASTEFKTLNEWSSLLALSVIAMVDEEFDVQLKGDDIKSAVTVEDLFHIVESKI